MESCTEAWESCWDQRMCHRVSETLHGTPSCAWKCGGEAQVKLEILKSQECGMSTGESCSGANPREKTVDDITKTSNTGCGDRQLPHWVWFSFIFPFCISVPLLGFCSESQTRHWDGNVCVLGWTECVLWHEMSKGGMLQVLLKHRRLDATLWLSYFISKTFLGTINATDPGFLLWDPLRRAAFGGFVLSLSKVLKS